MHRIAAVERHRLDEMDQDARPFDVAQELVTQADAAVGAFDQAGQVGQDEDAFAAGVDDAEVGVLGRERIVGDLRLGLRQPAEQRRLAGVGQADQAGVGDDLQFQDEPAFLAGRRPARYWRGARLVEVAKALLPRPPRPPLATTTSSPASVRSRRTLPRSRS